MGDHNTKMWSTFTRCVFDGASFLRHTLLRHAIVDTVWVVKWVGLGLLVLFGSLLVWLLLDNNILDLASHDNQEWEQQSYYTTYVLCLAQMYDPLNIDDCAPHIVVGTLERLNLWSDACWTSIVYFIYYWFICGLPFWLFVKFAYKKVKTQWDYSRAQQQARKEMAQRFYKTIHEVQQAKKGNANAK